MNINLTYYERRLERELKSEHYNPQEQIRAMLPVLSKSQMEELTTTIRKAYLSRFKRRRTPKYGNLNKGFTEPQLNMFFRAIDDVRFKLLFQFQATLGLRVGESVKVNIGDIDFETRELRIHTEKAKILDSLIIPISLFQELIVYIKEHKDRIEAAKGYLFYKEASKDQYQRAEPYFELNYVRRRFREYIDIADIDDVYDVSEETRANKKPRGLHRLTTHSLRHYAITKFAKSTNGNLILTSRFARHTDPSTTMVYISKDKKELYGAIDSMAVGEAESLKRRLGK